MRNATARNRRGRLHRHAPVPAPARRWTRGLRRRQRIQRASRVPVPAGVRFMPGRRHAAGGNRTGLRARSRCRLPLRWTGLDHPLLLGPDRGPAHQCRRHAERSPAMREVQGATTDLRQLDDALRRLQDGAHAGERALPAGLLLRHHQVRRRALRACHGPASRPRLRFRRDVAAHVQRLWPGTVLQQPLSGRAWHLLGQPPARRAHHHLRRRRADPRLRLHRRHRGGLGAGARHDPASRGRIINLGSGRSLSINDLANAVIAAFGQQAGGHQIVRAAARPGEQRSVSADIGLAKSLLGWEPRTPFETGLAETVRWARDEFAAAGGAASGGRPR